MVKVEIVEPREYYQNEQPRLDRSNIESLFGQFWEVNDFPVTVKHKPEVEKRFLLYLGEVDLDDLNGDGNPDARLLFPDNGAINFHYDMNDDENHFPLSQYVADFRLDLMRVVEVLGLGNGIEGNYSLPEDLHFCFPYSNELGRVDLGRKPRIKLGGAEVCLTQNGGSAWGFYIPNSLVGGEGSEKHVALSESSLAKYIDPRLHKLRACPEYRKTMLGDDFMKELTLKR